MSVLEAIFQGIVQGLTEFLPISSSGHLSIIRFFTGSALEDGNVFTVLLHLGTLLAVFIAFRKTILRLVFELCDMVVDIFKGRFSYKKAGPRRRMLLMLMVAQLPLLVVFPLKDMIEGFSSDGDVIVEGICFIITGIMLMAADRAPREIKLPGDIKPADALTIGAFQAFALMPGISRSGSTITGGLFRGLTRETAIEFSFIMGIPAVLAANVLELKDAVQMANTVDPLAMVIGVVSAAVFGILAIKMVSWLCKTNKFRFFAYYLFALGTVVIVSGFAALLTR